MLVLKSKYNILSNKNERLFKENVELHKQIGNLERDVTDYKGQRDDLIKDQEEIIDAKNELEEAYNELLSKLQKVTRNNKDNIATNKKLRKEIKSFKDLDIPNQLKLSKLELMTPEQSYEPGIQAFYSSFVDRLASKLKLIDVSFDIEAFKVECYNE